MRAQGTCGAAGGAPAGTPTVCDFAAEALGMPRSGPATGAGNPIDLVTGNKYRRDVDLRTPGFVAMPFARHYNSRNRFDGPLGVGWSHSLETRIAKVRVDDRDTVQIVQGDGRRIVFERDATRPRTWRTADPVDGVVRPSRVGPWYEWAWHWPDGRTLHFEHSGRVGQVDRDGVRVIDLNHDRAGRLRGVAGPVGRFLEFHYFDHPRGERLRQVTGRGENVEFGYDDLGQLTSMRWDDGRGYRYRYDDPHDPLLLTSVHAIDPAVPGEPREVARYAYDAQGRAVATAEQDADALRVDWRLPERAGDPGESIVTDASGRVARYRWQYDRRRHVARMLESSGIACGSCPPAPRRYAWDGAGRLAGIEAPAGTLRIERDPAGRPVAGWWTAADPGRSERLWRLGYADARPESPWSWMEQPSIAPGQVHRIEVERDAMGRVVAVAEHGFAPAPDRPADRAWARISRRFAMGYLPPPSDRVEGYRYALAGLSWVDGPEPGTADRIDLSQADGTLTLRRSEGLVETIGFTDWRIDEHSSAHGVASARLPYGIAPPPPPGTLVTSFWSGTRRIDLMKDASARLVGVERWDEHRGVAVSSRVDDPPPLAPAGRVESAWRGRPVAVRLADGSVFRRGFDDFGRVAWIEEPDAPRRWAAYDASDRLVEHRPGDGSILRHRRDAAGRLVESTLDDGNRIVTLGRYRWEGPRLAAASNDVVSIRYGWSAEGRLESAEHTFADAPDTPLRWTWRHDAAGRVVAESLPGGIDVCYQYSGDTLVGLCITGSGTGAVEIAPASLRVPMSLSPKDAAPPRDHGAVFSGDRLVRAADVVHRFDPHGRRAAKRAVHPDRADVERDFVHVDWRMRLERRKDGRLRHWIWAEDRPVALVEGGEVHRIVTDDRRAPVRALRADGRIAWSARYDRDGMASVSPGARIDVPLRLPGQYFDAESGLHHNHWRTYDPSAGRYLERDPLGLQPDWTGRQDMFAYAGGDPVGASDPWGLARVSFFAITSGPDGRPIGRDHGFDTARWSFMIEDIAPVPIVGRGTSPPQPAGIGSLLFDPWGDFFAGNHATGAGSYNGVDTVTFAGTSGRQLFASFAAHYGGLLTSSERFVVDAFDDRRAGALALILAASPDARRPCVGSVLAGLPGFTLDAAGREIRPGRTGSSDPPRLLACTGPRSLPVAYRDDAERERVERLQAAAELQESPGSSIRVDCAPLSGCRSKTEIAVNGRTYHASYGRTQFTVTTFLAELMRLTRPSGGDDATALRRVLGLDVPISIDGRSATVGDALALARSRVDATYRSFTSLRDEFGRGLDATTAGAIWDGLSPSRRAAFTSTTGLGAAAFVDMLGYSVGTGPRTEEEGRHAIAAAAAATVAWTVNGGGAARSFQGWMIDLFSSGEPYDHVSRAFLRDNLRRVLDAGSLAGRFDNAEAPGTQAWRARQQAIELDLARRVAVLHNSGNLALATSTSLDTWLQRNRAAWISQYVEQFVSTDARGNWESLQCLSGLTPGTALQMVGLSVSAAPKAGQQSPVKP